MALSVYPAGLFYQHQWTDNTISASEFCYGSFVSGFIVYVKCVIFLPNMHLRWNIVKVVLNTNIATFLLINVLVYIIRIHKGRNSFFSLFLKIIYTV